MYDYITGTLAELNPAFAVIDNQGIGYMINVSLTTYTTLQHDAGVGQRARLSIYEAIREDAHLLYGFASRQERELFLLLISVSGVGTNMARMILSSLPPEQLEKTIATGNVGMLKGVKGIGAKTAQRIIVDLKDKINGASGALISQGQAAGEAFDEAIAALTMLGFKQQDSQKLLKKLFLEQPGLTAEEAIKKALKMF